MSQSEYWLEETMKATRARKDREARAEEAKELEKRRIGREPNEDTALISKKFTDAVEEDISNREELSKKLSSVVANSLNSAFKNSKKRGPNKCGEIILGGGGPVIMPDTPDEDRIEAEAQDIEDEIERKVRITGQLLIHSTSLFAYLSLHRVNDNKNEVTIEFRNCLNGTNVTANIAFLVNNGTQDFISDAMFRANSSVDCVKNSASYHQFCSKVNYAARLIWKMAGSHSEGIILDSKSNAFMEGVKSAYHFGLLTLEESTAGQRRMLSGIHEYDPSQDDG